MRSLTLAIVANVLVRGDVLAPLAVVYMSF